MFATIFKETFLHLIRNSKNRLVVVLLFLGLGFYSLVLLPKQASIDTIDLNLLRQELFANKGMMDNARETGNFQVNTFTGQSTYQSAKYHYEHQRSLLAAIETGDAVRYLTILERYTPPFYQEALSEHYQLTSPYPSKDQTYDYLNFANRVNSYKEAGIPVNFHIIQEKTSLQQIQLFLLNGGPSILAVIALFIACDLFVSSRQHRTQKMGIPCSWGTYLFIQSLALLAFILVLFAATGLFFYLFNGFLFGFGALAWKVPAFTYSADFVVNPDSYTLMTIGRFLMEALPFLLLLLYLFIRLSVILSLFLRQEVLIFLSGLFILFFEQLYFNRTTRFIWGVHISHLPQTYFEFGKTITGAKNFLLNTGAVTFEKGLLVTVITILLVEAGLSQAVRRVDRQTFLALGGT